MTKYKIIFLLALGFIVCENVFSQAIKINYDSLMKKPYEFTVNKTKFRFRVYDTSSNAENNLVLEKYNAAWITADSFHLQSIRFKDINNDGFIDIGLLNRRESDVYLFNPTENAYVYSGEYSETEFAAEDDGYGKYPPHMDLIDKNKQIYCDFSVRWHHELWYSNLFQINNYKRINLGIIENETDYSKKTDDYETTGYTINKILNVDDNGEENRELIQKIKWNKNKSFNYLTYWKNNWQKFLPQKN